VALWNLSLIYGMSIAPPITGPIIAKLDWRWCFKLYAIACATLFFLQLIFMPETTYYRHSPRLSTKTRQARAGSDSEDLEKKEDIETVLRVNSLGTSQPGLPAAEFRKKSFLEGLAIFNQDVIAGADKSSFINLLVRPFIACLTPVCFWHSVQDPVIPKEIIERNASK